MSPKRLFVFDRYRLDEQERQLLLGTQVVPLPPKVFDLLAVLVQNAGRLISKQDLLDRVWSGVAVEEGSLTRGISSLRQVLGSTADGQDYIQTVSKRGYRFISQVRETTDDEAAQPVPANVTHEVESGLRIRKRWRTAAIAAGSILCGALAFGIWLVLPRSQPRVVGSTQLTNDGMWKCCLVTDGSRIYFSERDIGDISRMKYIPVTGGDPITIPMPSLDTFGGANIEDISPQHDKLLVLQQDVCLWWIVPLTGSSPRPLNNLGELHCGGARWSPDGQMLVYSAGSDIFLARSDGTNPRRLATTKGTARNPVWSPDAQSLRFALTDMKTPDIRSLFGVSLAGGEPQEVTPHWKDKAHEYLGKWTPDGKYFLFLSGGDGRLDIWAIREHQLFPWLRKRDPIRLTAGPLSYGSLTFSPDGKKIFTRGVERRGELQRYDRKSGHFQPFLGGLSADCCVYSNDGNWIAYVTFPEGSLWRSRSDGSQRQQLTWPPMTTLNPHWSPDGKEIAVSGLLPGKAWKTFIIRREGEEARELTQNDCSELDANWSPDRTYMIFAPYVGLDATSTSCPPVIYSMDLRTHQISTIPGSEGLWSPRWSPDGKRIVAMTRTGDALMIYETTSRKWAALVQPPGASVGFPQWSKDGTLVYYAATGAETGVYSIRIEDHETQRLADLSGIQTTGNSGYWRAVDPDGSPLILRDVGLNEIYALDLVAP